MRKESTISVYSYHIMYVVMFIASAWSIAQYFIRPIGKDGYGWYLIIPIVTMFTILFILPSFKEMVGFKRKDEHHFVFSKRKYLVIFWSLLISAVAWSALGARIFFDITW